MVEGYRLGANAYVRKLVSFDAFVDAVSTLALFWLVRNEPCPPPSPVATAIAGAHPHWRRDERRSPNRLGSNGVAGAGFEPATSGL